MKGLNSTNLLKLLYRQFNFKMNSGLMIIIKNRTLLQSLLHSFSTDNTINRNGGIKLYKDKLWQDALRIFNANIEVDSGHLESLYYKGLCLLELDESYGALETFVKVEQIDSNYENVSVRISVCRSRLNSQYLNLTTSGTDNLDAHDYELALHYYTEALLINPYVDVPYLGKGLALQGMERYEEALDYFTQATKYSQKGYLYKIDLWKKTNQPQKALECYDYVISEGTDKKVENVYNKGDYLYSLGRYEEALNCFNECLRIGRGYVPALLRKGLTLCRLDRYAEGVEYFSKDYGSFYINPLAGEIAEVLELYCRYEQALEFKRKALVFKTGNEAGANEREKRKMEKLNKY
jgi:tetratricopeptide (TPR) repeat protein